MKLKCYLVDSEPSEIVPGRPDRDWMDAFSERHPYRCLPMVVANTSGWELICPVSFTASWNGGPSTKDIRIDPDGDTDEALLRKTVVSHFSGGIITFHTGYLFRTEPGWDTWVSGPPNYIKDGVQALTGVVETDWLPFSFTMNYRFTRPGMVSFKKGEPFAWLMPIPHTAVDDTQPIILPIEADRQLHQDYYDWGSSRLSFLEKLHAKDKEARQKGWQRDYFRGQMPTGEQGPDSHINRRRLAVPRKAEDGE